MYPYEKKSRLILVKATFFQFVHYLEEFGPLEKRRIEKIMNGQIKVVSKVEGDLKVSFSIATTPRSRGGRYSILRIAQLYP